VLVIPAPAGRWIVTNVIARTALGLDTDGLALLRRLELEDETAIVADCGDRTFSIWHVQRFAQANGLLSDPAWFRRDASAFASEPTRVGASDFFRECRRAFLIVDDEAAYIGALARKDSVLDRAHLGNLHDQLGQALIVKERKRPDAWWIDQKFTPDRTDLLPGLYRAVQGYFLDAYIARKFHAGQAVLDVGCGIGYYAHRIARQGATVLGVDPSREYIEIARQQHSGARFEVADIGRTGGLDLVADHSIDVAFMSDALLLYFVPPVRDTAPDLRTLLDDVWRVLRPGGQFVVLEPHYAFFQTPWLGDASRPFTVLTEYTERRFGITGTLAELVQSFARRGFHVTWLEELKPDPAFAAVDARAYEYARAFPQWHLWEFLKAGTP
jgi:SAM-dependent methyltransferase